MNERRSRYARILRQILIAPPMLLIWVYRHGISPFTPPSCRFTPTCSQYFAEALRRARPAERLLPRHSAAAALPPLGRQRIRPRTVTGLPGNREAHALQPKRTVAARRAARSGHANRSVGKPIDETIRRIIAAPMCRPKASAAACGYRLVPQTGTLGHKASALSGAGDPGPLHVGHPIRPYRTRHNTGQDTARPVRLRARNVRRSDRRRTESLTERLTRSNLPFRSKVAPYTLPDSSLSAIRWSGQATNEYRSKDPVPSS